MSIPKPEMLYDSLGRFSFEEIEQRKRDLTPAEQQAIDEESFHLAEMEAEACRIFGPASQQATEIGKIAMLFHCLESHSTLHEEYVQRPVHFQSAA